MFLLKYLLGGEYAIYYWHISYFYVCSIHTLDILRHLNVCSYYKIHITQRSHYYYVVKGHQIL